MTITFISDTHGKHDQLKLTGGDMLIHAGDISSMGTVEEVTDFLAWFAKQPYEHKVFIGGNHDFLLEKQPELFQTLIPPNCTYLENESRTIAGIKIWGSPITPWFFDWAFNRKRGEEIGQYWEAIPTDTDILITHGPPHHILDRTQRGDYAGCADLLARVQIVKPTIHVFGHIHEAYGMVKKDYTTFINASNLNLRYQLVNQPVVIEWTK